MTAHLKLFDGPDTEPVKRTRKKKDDDTPKESVPIYERSCAECSKQTGHKIEPRFDVKVGTDPRFCTATAMCPVCGRSLGTDHYQLSDRLLEMMKKRSV